MPRSVTWIEDDILKAIVGGSVLETTWLYGEFSPKIEAGLVMPVLMNESNIEDFGR